MCQDILRQTLTTHERLPSLEKVHHWPPHAIAPQTIFFFDQAKGESLSND